MIYYGDNVISNWIYLYPVIIDFTRWCKYSAKVFKY